MNLPPKQFTNLKSINGSPPNNPSITGEQLARFYFRRIPFELPAEAAILKTAETETDRDWTRKAVAQFCKTWIPQLYGINPSYPLYRQACLCELYRQTSQYRIVSYKYMSHRWYWENSKGYVPAYLRYVVAEADMWYTLLQHTNQLPRYRLQIFN